MDCWARAGPAHMTTTSPPCFSLSWSASSSAYASGSLISKLRPDSSIQRPEAPTARGESRTGTCLIATNIFTAGSSFSEFLENQAAVGAATPERIRQHVFDGYGTRMIRHVIQVALRIGGFVIDRRRSDLIANRQHADPRLDSARATEKMAGHGFSGTDGHLVGVLSEGALDRDGFHAVS